MQVTVCAVDPSSDQLTSIQLPADASLTDAAQLLGNALTEDDSSVQQYWVNLDPESQDDVIPRLPHGDPIFEINLVLLSARPGGKRCVFVSVYPDVNSCCRPFVYTPAMHRVFNGCMACLDMTRQLYLGKTALNCYEVVSIRLSCH